MLKRFLLLFSLIAVMVVLWTYDPGPCRLPPRYRSAAAERTFKFVLVDEGCLLDVGFVARGIPAFHIALSSNFSDEGPTTAVWYPPNVLVNLLWVSVASLVGAFAWEFAKKRMAKRTNDKPLT